MPRTHICSERREKIQSMSGLDRSPSHPRNPREWALYMPACPCLQPPPQDPRLRGQVRACSKGQASKRRDFTCEKLKMKRF